MASLYLWKRQLSKLAVEEDMTFSWKQTVRRVWRAIGSYQVPDQNTQSFNLWHTHCLDLNSSW